MPEPGPATNGEQGEVTAATPQQADSPEITTTQQVAQPESDSRSVMDLLDIPLELQNQIAPKKEEPDKEPPPEPEPEEVKAEEPDEDEPDEDESEPEEKEEAKPQPNRAIQKLQKRVHRLTRQKSEFADQLDAASSTITELREQVKRFEKQAPVGMVPKVGPWMPDQETADSYGDLSQKKEVAKAKLAWCDKHRDGVTVSENGQEKFLDADEIAAWKSDAQNTLMEVQPEIVAIERESKQAFRAQKAQFDQLANTFWPELADKSSKEYQLSRSILKEYPSIAHGPTAEYAVGLVIEGMRAVQAKVAAANAKNGNLQTPSPKKHRDIDERVFTTPRVPIAPHTSGPPTRESSSSSQKRLQEANEQLLNDPDGSAENLAKVFQAREAAATRHNPRGQVRV